MPPTSLMLGAAGRSGAVESAKCDAGKSVARLSDAAFYYVG